jgi:hypothetical protein
VCPLPAWLGPFAVEYAGEKEVHESLYPFSNCGQFEPVAGKEESDGGHRKDGG